MNFELDLVHDMLKPAVQVVQQSAESEVGEGVVTFEQTTNLNWVMPTIIFAQAGYIGYSCFRKMTQAVAGSTLKLDYIELIDEH